MVSHWTRELKLAFEVFGVRMTSSKKYFKNKYMAVCDVNQWLTKSANDGYKIYGSGRQHDFLYQV